jgi:hypothetical protein
MTLARIIAGTYVMTIVLGHLTWALLIDFVQREFPRVLQEES